MPHTMDIAYLPTEMRLSGNQTIVNCFLLMVGDLRGSPEWKSTNVGIASLSPNTKYTVKIQHKSKAESKYAQKT